MIHLERHLWSAWSALARNDVQEALRLVDAVLRDNPANTSALRLGASISRRQGHWKKALGYLAQLSRYWPEEQWRYRLVEAQRAVTEGHGEAADRFLQQLLQPCPSSTANAEACLAALSELVHLEVDAGAPEKARQTLADHPVEHLPLGPSEELRYANLFLAAGDAAACEQHLRRVAADHPSLPDARLALGNLYREQGRNAQAIAAFQEAIALDPTFFHARNNLATLLGSLGQLDSSNRQLRDVLQWDPGNARALGNLALNRYLQGETSEAVELLQRAISLDRKAIQPRVNLALIYLKLDQHRKAVALCREVLRLEPDNRVARNVVSQYG